MSSEQGSLVAPNIITLLQHAAPESPVVEFLHHFEVPFFSAIVILGLVTVARLASRKPKLIPSGLQNVVELLVDTLDQFIVGVMGSAGRQFTPFVGTLFFYILAMNLIGLVPGMHAPTSSINTTIALAVTVFFYVQYTGLRSLGLLGYFDHLAGNPRPKGIGGYLIALFAVPFNLMLHTIGEFIKPVSLSVRLFGNIFGEDVLIAQMLLLGVVAMSFMNSPVGIPLQFPFYLLGMLMSLIQAVVFSLLTVIYLFLMLPHHEHQEEHQTHK